MLFSLGMSLAFFVVSKLTPGRNNGCGAMQDPNGIRIVLIAPGTKWVAVCEYDQSLGFNLIFFQVVEDSNKVSATTATGFVVANTIQVV